MVNRSWAEHELNSPRDSVVAAIDALDLQPGMSVLDIGCGPGVHLPLFARRIQPGGQITGLDVDPERLELGRELLAQTQELDRITLRQGDLHTLPFAKNSFDVVWMALVLHHEELPFDVVRSILPVVKPGGRLAILEGDGGGSFPLLPWPPAFELRLRAAALRADQERYDESLPYGFTGYLGRQLPALLCEAGLIEVRLRAFADVRQMPLSEWDREDIQDWIVNSFGRRMRDYLAPRDWEALAGSVDPEHQDYLLNDPGFFLTRTWYLVTGRVPTR